MRAQPLPHLMTINAFCAWSSLGRTKVYDEIKLGRLRSIRVGGRRLIRADDAEAWLEGHARAS